MSFTPKEINKIVIEGEAHNQILTPISYKVTRYLNEGFIIKPWTEEEKAEQQTLFGLLASRRKHIDQ